MFDLEIAILNDELIEEYADDYSMPSVLLLGFLEDQTPLHIVCTPTDLDLVVITAYRPSRDLWKDNWTEKKQVIGEETE